MENKRIIGLAIMSVVMGTTIATAGASGIREGFRNPVGMNEVIRAEREALRSRDYQGWRSAVENSGQTEILEVINESNFARFSEAFALCESGDLEGAEAIIGEMEGVELPECGVRRSLGLSLEERAALKTALVNSDYDGWKELMEKGGNEELDKYLTQENFGVLVRACRLIESGDRAGAMDLLDEADIPRMMLAGGGKRHGGERGEMAFNESNREILAAAYENGDYEAWKALMEGRGGKILEIVDADNFAEYSRAKLFQLSGQPEEAKEILDGLGFPFSERKARVPGTGTGTQ